MSLLIVKLLSIWAAGKGADLYPAVVTWLKLPIFSRLAHMPSKLLTLHVFTTNCMAFQSPAHSCMHHSSVLSGSMCYLYHGFKRERKEDRDASPSAPSSKQARKGGRQKQVPASTSHVLEKTVVNEDLYCGIHINITLDTVMNMQIDKSGWLQATEEALATEEGRYGCSSHHRPLYHLCWSRQRQGPLSSVSTYIYVYMVLASHNAQKLLWCKGTLHVMRHCWMGRKTNWKSHPVSDIT